MNTITLLKLAEMEAEGAMMKELAGEAQDAGIDPTAVDQEALIEALLSQGDETQAEEQNDLAALLAAAEQEAGGGAVPGAEMPMEGAGVEQGSPDIMALLSALGGEGGDAGMSEETPEESFAEESDEAPAEDSEEDSGEDEVEEIKEAAMQKAASFLRGL